MPSLDRRVTYATRRYFANKELRNRVNTRVDRWREDGRVYTYNALGNAARQIQMHCFRRQRPESSATAVCPLQSMGQLQEFTHHTVY